jgi:predicted HD phosphohydrolase
VRVDGRDAYDGTNEHPGEAAARWLEPRVGARVAWLAEQHVPAKRYLVATDPAYLAGLSEVSARTLVAHRRPRQGAGSARTEVSTTTGGRSATWSRLASRRDDAPR